MPNAALGIDYGTSSTVAVLRHPGGKVRPLLFDSSPLLPSAVYRNDAGRLLVGRDAEHAARLDPARYEPHPKRRIDDLEVLLGDRAVPVAELVAATLTRIREEVVRTLGGPPATVTMTCPATWGAARRQVLLDAAAQAGLPVPALVAEPVAAATYFAAVLGHAVRPGQSIVVYDLGAGTFDASVVQRTDDGFRDLACRGLDDVGGLDLDALVVAHARTVVEPAGPDTWRRLAAPQSAADLRHATMLWTDARHLRETLSRESSASMFVPAADREVLFTRQQFDAAAEPLLARTVQLALTTVKEARIRPETVAGWFLVGGGTRTPLIATLLHRATGVAPTVLEEPQLVVAEGALHLATEPTPEPARAPARPEERLWPDPPKEEPRRQAPQRQAPQKQAPQKQAPQTTTPRSEAPRKTPVDTGVGTGFAEVFALVAAAFAALVLLAPLVQGESFGPRPTGGAALAVAVAWRAWRLRRPGPRAGDWAAVAVGVIGVGFAVFQYVIWS